MTKFLTRKSDKQVFPVKGKDISPKASINPQVVSNPKPQKFKITKKEKFDKIGMIIAYESGELSDKDTLKLFQHLVDTGEVWHLQGHYGRVANDLLQQGLIKPPKKKTKQNTTDYYGHKINFEKYPKKDDIDRDGVKNKDDCEPLNPKKHQAALFAPAAGVEKVQKKIHDTAIRLLKQREQNLENKRLQQLKKLEETKERLNEKKAIQQTKLAKKQQKQAIIDEIKAEKQQIKNLKKANVEAKKRLFAASPTGRVISHSAEAIEKTQKFFKKPSTKKAMRKLDKLLGG